MAADDSSISPALHGVSPLPDDARVPALVQHFEGTASLRQQGSSGPDAAPADPTSQSLSAAATATDLAIARAGRMATAVNQSILSPSSSEMPRRWTAAREDMPSVARAATRDSVFGPEAVIVAAYRRKTEEASCADQEQLEPASASSDQRASPSSASAIMTRAGSVRETLAAANVATTTASSGDMQTEASRADSGAGEAASADALAQKGLTRQRSERTVRFSSGLADEITAADRSTPTPIASNGSDTGASAVSAAAADIAIAQRMQRPSDHLPDGQVWSSPI